MYAGPLYALMLRKAERPMVPAQTVTPACPLNTLCMSLSASASMLESGPDLEPSQRLLATFMGVTGSQMAAGIAIDTSQCGALLRLVSSRQRLTWSLVPVLPSFAELQTPRQQCLMAPRKEALPDLSACEASLITRLVALEKSLHGIDASPLNTCAICGSAEAAQITAQ